MASEEESQETTSQPELDPSDEDHTFAKIDFRIETNPAMNEAVQPPRYSLSTSKKEEELNQYPEMNFRRLADVYSWADTEPLTHGIHKHPAIFIPHIPRYLINTFSTELNESGERSKILDPFCGSGTTGIEAKIAGRDFVGVEINPLSKLVSEVATTPIPYTTVKHVMSEVIRRLEDTPPELYKDYDVEFLDQTEKHHWFEDPAIEGLTTIRKVVSEFLDDDFELQAGLELRERKVVSDLNLGDGELHERVSKWLILMIANTVFEVSNADPGVSKAHKSKKMRELIENEEHPPDTVETFKEQLKLTSSKLIDLWNEVYKTNAPGGTKHSVTISDTENSTLLKYADNWIPLEENQSHKAEMDIRLGDARDFSYPEHKEDIDMAITSPPYINAINYYRGTKLRLFWIHDLLEDATDLDPKELRRSIIGSNSVSIQDVDRDLPLLLNDEWVGTWKEFENTTLPLLDEHIMAIHNGDLSEAKSRAYITWKFFAEEMLQSLTSVYRHLKPGAYFFFIIGENTIGGRRIQSHRFIADIARNLGKFKNQDDDIVEDEGYRVAGMAWDKISNRDLFEGRDHGNGVIEREWVVILQKPI